MAMVGNMKDLLELDELSDAALKHNFGYTDAGIETLRADAKQAREEGYGEEAA
jgi:hypothetical protein